ncbi:SGNH/GDSL hydrolase family protein [Leifsonia sp. ZF2019]|uniref:SGNH/GDSL hydrolase family protein n=1 Tax=Leifsonia sp. ZF2019 TaxID=2781978 RepID=UPI001CBF693B|nr:SGNH/GDSL hydrolase family protein [Leifsonia sp. ZF2019]
MSSPIQLAAFGDSITKGRKSASWVNLLRHSLGPSASITNYGIDGDHMTNVRRRASSMQRSDCTHILILAGTNDTLWTHLNLWRRAVIRIIKRLTRRPSHKTTRIELERLLQTLTRQYPRHIAVCTIPPLGNSATTADLTATNRTIIEVAASVGVTVLPVYERLTLLAELPSAPRIMLHDGIHLSQAGATELALTIEDWIRETKYHMGGTSTPSQ